jgi:hypothetical protein
MIIIVNNMTETKADGTSDYEVKILLANAKVIAHFEILNHVRTDPASFLIHRIADELTKQQALLKATTVVN